MSHSRWILLLFVAGLATSIAVVPRLRAHKANPSSAEQTAPRSAAPQHEPTTAAPPEAYDRGGPSPAKTRAELLVYLRDSFAALKKSLSAITAKNMCGPVEAP